MENNYREEQSLRHQVTDDHIGYKSLCSLDILDHFGDSNGAHGVEVDDDEEVSATKETHGRLGEDNLDDTLEYLPSDMVTPHVQSGH
ncbi:hypothetical protein scyTo_0016387 [Scyliorhinus torazame]|uniref:Uncharacterized protein n=1 Tax=Scyliorhinus torazame TaxID=75743 RepID=A0A401PQ34_SCYTO|nr:hypothetical protein [Scyliorhinus torazame]